MSIDLYIQPTFQQDTGFDLKSVDEGCTQDIQHSSLDTQVSYGNQLEAIDSEQSVNALNCSEEQNDGLYDSGLTNQPPNMDQPWNQNWTNEVSFTLDSPEKNNQKRKNGIRQGPEKKVRQKIRQKSFNHFRRYLQSVATKKQSKNLISEIAKTPKYETHQLEKVDNIRQFENYCQANQIPEILYKPDIFAEYYIAQKQLNSTVEEVLKKMARNKTLGQFQLYVKLIDQFYPGLPIILSKVLFITSISSIKETFKGQCCKAGKTCTVECIQYWVHHYKQFLEEIESAISLEQQLLTEFKQVQLDIV